jgi:PIH1 N-terminal domain
MTACCSPLPPHRFVIKTTEETGRKVFINVCGAAEVDAVGDWAGGQVGLCTC